MDVWVRADDGVTLWSSAVGDGPPLLFVHGGPGLWDYFDGVAAMFPQRRAIRWDQRGGGRSERRGPYTIARFVGDLDAVRARHGVERVDLFGHSWGAFLALRYAVAHPDQVRRLVYVSGVGVDPTHTWRPGYRAAFRERIAPVAARFNALDGRATRTDAEEREYAELQWSVDFADPATALAQARTLTTPWYGINWEANATLGAELSAHLLDTDIAGYRDLALPTLIADGGRDVRPRWAVDSLAATLRDVRRVTFDDAGHNPWAERPAEFAAAVEGFLTG